MLRILRTTSDERPSRERPELPQQPARRYLRLHWSPWLDVAVAMVAFGAAEFAVVSDYAYGQPRWPSALLIAAATLSLAVRRRFPLAVMLVTISAVSAQQLLDDRSFSAVTIAAPLIAAYTVGAHCPRWRAITVIAISVPIIAAAETIVWGEDGFVWFLFMGSTLLGMPALSGRAMRVHRRQAATLRTLTERLRRERDALARLAIVEERTRLARELHDAIAHGVSVMVLQAGAAEQVLSSSPEQARQAAYAVQETGRAVLEELSRLLGLLHTDEDSSPRAPEPSLDDLDGLLAQVRQAGLSVQLSIDGIPAPLPAGLDASAYRVIQEALTNTLKHAGAPATLVSVHYEPTVITLEVLSEGAATGTRAAGGGGHGLVGMRERVELYGGDLHAGPEPTGGYAVRARLPLGSQDE